MVGSWVEITSCCKPIGPWELVDGKRLVACRRGVGVPTSGALFETISRLLIIRALQLNDINDLGKSHQQMRAILKDRVWLDVHVFVEHRRCIFFKADNRPSDHSFFKNKIVELTRKQSWMGVDTIKDFNLVFNIC